MRTVRPFCAQTNSDNQSRRRWLSQKAVNSQPATGYHSGGHAQQCWIQQPCWCTILRDGAEHACMEDAVTHLHAVAAGHLGHQADSVCNGYAHRCMHLNTSIHKSLNSLGCMHINAPSPPPMNTYTCMHAYAHACAGTWCRRLTGDISHSAAANQTTADARKTVQDGSKQPAIPPVGLDEEYC